MYIENAEAKMQKAIENMEARFTNVRAGRANPAMLNGINVEYYGASTPLNQVANITVPEARQLFIKPFDKTLVKEIEKAIHEANLGITPTNNGEMVILTIPELNEERRKEYVKQIKGMGEDAKVALRNAREDARNEIKKAEMPEDEQNRLNDKIQELITKYNKIVDDKVKEKENELMSV
ncbi:MAG: ribosome recycling factor [Tenericutes bacterium]|nr:ribosome recycling factor [Mycoplasmatota bacterium]